MILQKKANSDGTYSVEGYAAVGSSNMKWHTLRTFNSQGDATLFKELCEMHKVDPMRFIQTYRKDTVCYSFSFCMGIPKLKLATLAKIKE